MKSPQSPDVMLSRRGALRLTLGAGAAAALSGIGCSGKKIAKIGDPIPADPTFLRTSTVATSSPTLARPTGMPPVLARSTWTSAKPHLWNANPMGRITRITVHHDGMPTFIGTGKGDAADRLQRIYKVHVHDNGWADIGYHYVIDPAGRIWDARSNNLQGAHVKDNNEQNLGIMVMGNFNNTAPTDAAKRSLVDLITAQRRLHSVSLPRVKTHQEINPTECPGHTLQRFMVQARTSSGSIAMARL